MKEIIDITVVISPSLPVWPGDPAVGLERVMKLEDGDVANVTSLHFGAHTGTHMDAPFHFIQSGRKIESIALDELIGKAQVIEIDDDVDIICSDLLKELEIKPGIQRILFKTRNSKLWEKHSTGFDTGYVALSQDGAEYLIEQGIRLVGIDYLSIAPYHDQISTHHALLGAGVIVVEGLDLREAEPGEYTLVCLPIKLAGADGAPVRAALIPLDR